MAFAFGLKKILRKISFLESIQKYSQVDKLNTFLIKIAQSSEENIEKKLKPGIIHQLNSLEYKNPIGEYPEDENDDLDEMIGLEDRDMAELDVFEQHKDMRQLAAQWYSGQSDPLYEFVSSGMFSSIGNRDDAIYNLTKDAKTLPDGSGRQDQILSLIEYLNNIIPLKTPEGIINIESGFGNVTKITETTSVVQVFFHFIGERDEGEGVITGEYDSTSFDFIRAYGLINGKKFNINPSDFEGILESLRIDY